MFGWSKKRESRNTVSRGRIPGHLASRFSLLESIPPSSPPTPWRELPKMPVGGLTGIGFAARSDYLLIVSHDGLGLVDCRTGEKVSREYEGAYDIDVGTLMIGGIGPVAGQEIRIAGILGGGLPTSTVDGWSLDKHPLSWPNDVVFLMPPGQTLLWSRDDSVTGICRLPDTQTEVRAFGFSPDGQTMAVATSSDVSLYVRSS
jgi:hypothetical protein